ncbi:unnamed protein product [Caenorhabditis brenneri]
MFLGIPHITPPIGNLRFRKPKLNRETWNGVLETKEFKPACMSDPVGTYLRPEGGPISEDCLYINVYTNDFCLTYKNCSVMVAVHGGQMIRGSTATYRSDVITNNFVGQDRNIVVVTVPYRLGVFGLPNLPGDLDGVMDRNLVLYDVIAGLEWVQLEIANFGGNPNKTTFFGHSGGGSIGSVLSLLPEYGHLWQKMVLMSAPWLMRSKSANSKMFLKVAEHVGCTGSKNQEIIDCLRAIPAQKLSDTQEHVFRFEEESIADFVIDGELLKTHPRQILKSGAFPKKPLMIGTVPYEMRFTQYFNKTGLVNQEELLELCELLGFVGAYQDPYDFVEKCVEFYMEADTFEFPVDDFVFHVPAALLAQSHASEHPVYLYSYKYPGLGSGFTSAPSPVSPVHSEDFVYLFGVHRSSNFTTRDLKIEHIYSGMVADFVNFGVPKGQEWKKLNPEIMNYMDIDFDKDLVMPGMKYEFYKKRTEFWNEKWAFLIFKKYFSLIFSRFSFNEISTKSFDVFPLRELVEAKNILLKTRNWNADKTVESAKKNVAEIEKLIEESKKKKNLPGSD